MSQNRVGQAVSYEDQANPRRYGVIVAQDPTSGQWLVDWFDGGMSSVTETGLVHAEARNADRRVAGWSVGAATSPKASL